ncbi:MAG: YggT family protein [Anaerolineales bacterium]|jgi:YggT family protein
MASLIIAIGNVLSLIVLVDVVVSWVVPNPYNPFRQALDRIVEPMMAPIRSLVPPLGSLDFSPLILLILIQVITSVLANLVAG